MSILKRIVNRFRRKYALYCINKRYCGTVPKYFDKKLKAMRVLGYKVGDNTKVVGPIDVTGKLTIGNNCWIGKDFCVHGNGHVVIEDNCDIAPLVLFNTGGHKIGDKNRRAGEGVINNITVGRGTWIGTHVTIVNNISIGKGNVIAAGSVVISDTEDNVLVAGVPARVKRNLE